MLKLALAHLKYNRILSAILVLCLTITIFLPLVTWLASGMLKEQMTARSDETPILIGSKGSPFLLTLNSVYFQTEIRDTITRGTLNKYRERCAGEVIPLHTKHTARDIPVVGTSYEYFNFRGLAPAEGRLPALLGEAAAGSEAARRRGLKPGGWIVSDSESVYDISAEYPLKLRITGVLKETGTPDDYVIFTDVKTAWVMDGICHGHEDAIRTAEDADDTVIFIEASEVKYNSRLKKYNEITPENVHTFHFHGDTGDYPLSALVLVPESDKERVLVKSETDLDGEVQAVTPSKVIADILGIIFDVKKVLDGFSGLVFLSTAAFLFLVLSLQFRLRKDEMEIIYRIGGSRHSMEMLLGLETMILLGVSLVLAAALSLILIEAARAAMMF